MKRTCICGASIEQPDWSEMMSIDSLLKTQASGLDPVFNFDLKHKDCKVQPTPEIIDYLIVSLSWTTDVEAAVKKMMLEGWKPWGSLVVIVRPGGTGDYPTSDVEYAQVMVKYKST
jgi:hypothetical protein